MGALQTYIDLFNDNRQLIDGHSAGVLNDVRDEALAQLARQGFPTRKAEEYRYVDIEALMAHDYGLNLGRLGMQIDPYRAFRCSVPHMDSSLLFQVNDTFYANDKNLSSLPNGVVACSLIEAAAKYPGLLQRHYARYADGTRDGMTAFNTAFAQDGLFLYVPAGVQVEKPVQVVNILRSNVDLLINRRVLVVLEDGASLRLLTCDHTTDDVQFLATQVIEAYVGANASFRLYEMEETRPRTHRVSNLYVHQEADSRVLLGGITLNNGLTRNQTEVRLCGQGAEADLLGTAVSDGRQMVDTRTFVEHAVPRCTSRQLFKNVLNGEATGAFAGLVLVRPGAHHTQSDQTNRNLCLTPQARMYTQPQLEIYNDDVQCNHGAAIGQLDEAALFYMQQRGIARDEARLLLMFAFVNEVIDQIDIPMLKDRLHYLVEQRFRGQLAQRECPGCDLCKPLND